MLLRNKEKPTTRVRQCDTGGPARLAFHYYLSNAAQETLGLLPHELPRLRHVQPSLCVAQHDQSTAARRTGDIHGLLCTRQSTTARHNVHAHALGGAHTCTGEIDGSGARATLAWRPAPSTRHTHKLHTRRTHTKTLAGVGFGRHKQHTGHKRDRRVARQQISSQSASVEHVAFFLRHYVTTNPGATTTEHDNCNTHSIDSDLYGRSTDKCPTNGTGATEPWVNTLGFTNSDDVATATPAPHATHALGRNTRLCDGSVQQRQATRH